MKTLITKSNNSKKQFTTLISQIIHTNIIGCASNEKRKKKIGIFQITMLFPLIPAKWLSLWHFDMNGSLAMQSNWKFIPFEFPCKTWCQYFFHFFLNIASTAYAPANLIIFLTFIWTHFSLCYYFHSYFFFSFLLHWDLSELYLPFPISLNESLHSTQAISRKKETRWRIKETSLETKPVTWKWKIIITIIQ